jgi:hypothetical protein
VSACGKAAGGGDVRGHGRKRGEGEAARDETRDRVFVCVVKCLPPRKSDEEQGDDKSFWLICG